ncbi:MAG: hypothetical protein CMH54_14765 [Myxococcales bacterium]|nr:hypothetical protein [Myxococcales bacterium]
MMDLKGRLLVAMPTLLDPNFQQSIVLIVEHNLEDGTFGLVLNRPGPLRVDEFCSSIGIDWVGDEDHVVHEGGPVNPSVGWLLHEGEPDPVDSTPITDGIHLSTSREVLQKLAMKPNIRRRLYSGYAGWSPGQLAEEMRYGSWLTSDLPSDIVFSNMKEQAWHRVMKHQGIDPVTLVPGSYEVS